MLSSKPAAIDYKKGRTEVGAPIMPHGAVLVKCGNRSVKTRRFFDCLALLAFLSRQYFEARFHA
jgi:hypothetical protein